MTTKREIPVIQIQYGDGEWTEPMTTDVAIEQFDFGERHDERNLDRIALGLAVGAEYAVPCEYGDDSRWMITIRRAS